MRNGSKFKILGADFVLCRQFGGLDGISSARAVRAMSLHGLRNCRRSPAARKRARTGMPGPTLYTLFFTLSGWFWVLILPAGAADLTAKDSSAGTL